MSSLIRPPVLVVTALLLVLGGASLYLRLREGRRRHDRRRREANTNQAAGPRSLNTGAEEGRQPDRVADRLRCPRPHSRLKETSAQPENMEQFLTAVTKDVDAYWTKAFKDSGLPEPRVSYKWIPAGQTAASACGDGDGDGTVGDSAAAYCSGDDTIRVLSRRSSRPTSTTARSTRRFPAARRGTAGRSATSRSAVTSWPTIMGREVQDELGLFQKYGQQLPTMAFELQADCYAGTWANSAYKENRLEEPRYVQEALDAALAVQATSTPTTRPITARPRSARRRRTVASRRATHRRAAGTSTRPSLGDEGDTQQQVPGAGDPQEQDPGAGGAAPQQSPDAGGAAPQQDPAAGDPQEQDPGAGSPAAAVPGLPVRMTPAPATGREQRHRCQPRPDDVIDRSAGCS